MPQRNAVVYRSADAESSLLHQGFVALQKVVPQLTFGRHQPMPMMLPRLKLSPSTHFISLPRRAVVACLPEWAPLTGRIAVLECQSSLGLPIQRQTFLRKSATRIMAIAKYAIK